MITIVSGFMASQTNNLSHASSSGSWIEWFFMIVFFSWMPVSLGIIIWLDRKDKKKK